MRPRKHEYVRSAGDFAWLPGARDAISRLARAGFALAVVSNQRGVARGLVTRHTLSEVEVRIQRDLRPLGCSIAAFRYCPHEAHEECECRKPRPGMLLELAAALDVDLPSSWMVGDAETDVLAGAAAGCRTALIGGAAQGVRPDVVAASLADASALITAELATA